MKHIRPPFPTRFRLAIRLTLMSVGVVLFLLLSSFAITQINSRKYVEGEHMTPARTAIGDREFQPEAVHTPEAAPAIQYHVQPAPLPVQKVSEAPERTNKIPKNAAAKKNSQAQIRSKHRPKRQEKIPDHARRAIPPHVRVNRVD